jgi:hypothetical protein
LPQRLKPLILLRAFERSGVAFSLVSFFWRSKRKKLAKGETLFKISLLQATNPVVTNKASLLQATTPVVTEKASQFLVN